MGFDSLAYIFLAQGDAPNSKSGSASAGNPISHLPEYLNVELTWFSLIQATIPMASMLAPTTLRFKTGMHQCKIDRLMHSHSIESQIHNQDDCLAVNKGTNIVFKGNSCTGGHGISIVSP